MLPSPALADPCAKSCTREVEGAHLIEGVRQRVELTAERQRIVGGWGVGDWALAGVASDLQRSLLHASLHLHLQLAPYLSSHRLDAQLTLM